MRQLRGYRYFAELEERDHRAQIIQQRPGPGENISPLAVPKGASAEHELRDCMKCVYMPDCLISVLNMGPFELEVCEMQTTKRKYAQSGEYTGKGIRRSNDRAMIMDAIRRRRIFSMQDIHFDTGLHHSTVRGHFSHLVADGVIRHVRRDGKAYIYELVE